MQIRQNGQTVYTLVDSGASHSLMEEESYRKLTDEPLSSPETDLRSVTGQKLHVVESVRLSFWMTETLLVQHKFQVVRDLGPYKAIFGLDFLIRPGQTSIRCPMFCSSIRRLR